MGYASGRPIRSSSTWPPSNSPAASSSIAANDCDVGPHGNLRMPYPAFDRSRLIIRPLSERQHDLDLSILLPLDADLPPCGQSAFPVLGQRLVAARSAGRARILMMGAHVLRAGVARFL